MTHDTTKDPRLIVANMACAMLKKNVKQKTAVQVKISRDRLVELASTCESAIMTLMYMYQDPQTLIASEPVTTLSQAAQTFSEAYEKLLTGKDDQSMLRANIRWCIRTLSGLPQRLENSAASLAAGVDLVVLQIRNIAREGNLFKTRVTDGSANYSVVTNLKDVQTNTGLAAAFLPPREVGGVISEAMFLGSGKRGEPAGAVLAEEQVDAGEAASILYDTIKKYLK
jgi:predicted RNA-binding protein with EMAP domain